LTYSRKKGGTHLLHNSTERLKGGFGEQRRFTTATHGPDSEGAIFEEDGKDLNKIIIPYMLYM
jgi:hypothetical protein